MKESKSIFSTRFCGALVLGALTLTVCGLAMAGEAAPASSGGPTIGSIATTVTANFSNLAKLITACAYVCGLGFFVGAILKFKQHKDNPTQIPIGTPIAMLFVAASLVFLPTIFNITGNSVFGTAHQAGTATGVDPFTSTTSTGS
jgi:intracellular multiplication protein IcmD